jgi:hypothetical protein
VGDCENSDRATITISLQCRRTRDELERVDSSLYHLGFQQTAELPLSTHIQAGSSRNGDVPSNYAN